MKYGSQLYGRSVPEWRAHNVLYNDMKDEIKRITSRDDDEAAHDKLARWFEEEFNTISLFVKSKHGEIEHRVALSQKLVDAIAGSGPDSGPRRRRDSSLPSNIVSYAASRADGAQDPAAAERDALTYQLHLEISRLIRDIQQLSRFIGAQHTGFRKLLKKYRKWSGDPHKLINFERQLEGPDSFTRIDFTPSFLELSLLYDMIRSGKFSSAKDEEHAVDPAGKDSLSLADKLCNFDASMISQPTQGIRLWVHHDNMIEVKLFLLQHLSLLSDAADGVAQVNNFTFLDTTGFDYTQACKEPGQILTVTTEPGKPDQEVSAPVLCAPTGSFRHFTAKTITPALRQDIVNGKLSPQVVDNEDTSGKLALGWILNREAVRVAIVTTSRARFHQAGTANGAATSSHRIWAAIDSDVVVKNSSSPLARFPYSVLDIRWASEEKPAFVKELENGHLVHAVSSSFGLNSYALMIIRPEIFVATPSWMVKLRKGEDIRQVVQTSRKPRCAKSDATLRPQKSIGILLNNSAPELVSDDGAKSPETTENMTRYWNEFDHPDDEDDRDAFAIFIDDEYEHFKKAQVAEKLSQPIMQFSKRVYQSMHKIKHILGIDDSHSDNAVSSDEPSESHSLLSSEPQEGLYSPRLAPTRGSNSYDTFAAEVQPSPSVTRDMIMTMLATFCFGLAFFITFVTYGIILGDDGAILPLGIKLVIIIGLVFSIVLAGLGTCIFYLRERPSWNGEVTVHAMLLGVICVGVGGIALVIADY